MHQKFNSIILFVKAEWKNMHNRRRFFTDIDIYKDLSI